MSYFALPRDYMERNKDMENMDGFKSLLERFIDLPRSEEERLAAWGIHTSTSACAEEEASVNTSASTATATATATEGGELDRTSGDMSLTDAETAVQVQRARESAQGYQSSDNEADEAQDFPLSPARDDARAKRKALAEKKDGYLLSKVKSSFKMMGIGSAKRAQVMSELQQETSDSVAVLSPSSDEPSTIPPPAAAATASSSAAPATSSAASPLTAAQAPAPVKTERPPAAASSTSANSNGGSWRCVCIIIIMFIMFIVIIICVIVISS